ncbi:MAG: SpoIID/LytB domain-containing protein, partial [Flavobacteriales bacterium]|nr:SpoIID/LytB domain-containing protein [Flavobacteriales bacterium]
PMKHRSFHRIFDWASALTAQSGIMWLRCLILAFSITILISRNTSAQEQLEIGLLGRSEIASILISPTAGNYMALNGESDTIYRFRTDDAISITANGSRLIAKSAYGLNDTLNKISLVGKGTNPSFKMRVNNKEKEYSYFDNLTVTGSSGKLRLVNSIDLESYVSHVVQAEVGYGAEEEYYKIQSIICRTYAVRNKKRHMKDGFNLCDHEHCQVYSGRKTATNEVVKSTAATSGLVMVSRENELILSAFHANCGGQTANCEDVWKEPRSYLKSVKDTFCLSSRSAVWNETIEQGQLLARVGFNATNDDSTTITFNQPERLKFFNLENDSIELSRMRRRLRLRSTFFDLKTEDGQVTFNGRGYGHGVGLCQQGAMKMAEYGYNHSQILGYYYQGVSVVQLNELQLSK